MPKKEIRPEVISQFKLHRRMVIGKTIDFTPSRIDSRYVLPRRPADESSKICREHGRRQSRDIQNIGPITEAQMIQIHINEVASGKPTEIFLREPLRSHKSYWKRFRLTRWLVTPIPGLYYATFGNVKCPDCREGREEKAYFRLQGRMGLFTLRCQIYVRTLFPIFMDSYSLVPYNPSKSLREHLRA